MKRVLHTFLAHVIAIIGAFQASAVSSEAPLDAPHLPLYDGTRACAETPAVNAEISRFSTIAENLKDVITTVAIVNTKNYGDNFIFGNSARTTLFVWIEFPVAYDV